MTQPLPNVYLDADAVLQRTWDAGNAGDRERFGEQGRRLRARGDALAARLFDRPVAELSRREMATLFEQMAAAPEGGDR